MASVPNLTGFDALPANIPYGYCHCGCGYLAPTVQSTWRARGRIKGQPFRFIAGHQRLPRPDLSNALPFKIDGVYCRLIALTRGQVTIVDAADYDWLNQWAWSAQWNGCTHSYYATRRQLIDGKWTDVRMNRLILGLAPGEKGDHCNGITLMNNRKNLRKADSSENAINARRRRDSKSGVKGVFWEPRKQMWRVRVQFRERAYHGGFFSDLDQAAHAHDRLYRMVAGEFARERVMQ